ncbi:177_t:CDS:2 [Rhizophagus irregularis]|nr:177_t:CDS:2 [Rhizophagus irregularis]
MCILRDVATDVADHTTGFAMSETDILASTSTFVTATGTSFTQAKYNGHLSQFYKLKSQDEQKVV